MKIKAFDHTCLVVSDKDKMADFYRKCGFEIVNFKNTVIIWFGKQKIVFLHVDNINVQEHNPKNAGIPGSTKYCFVIETPAAEAKKDLESQGIEVDGPKQKEGKLGKSESIYAWDPEGNILEFIHYIQ